MLNFTLLIIAVCMCWFFLKCDDGSLIAINIFSVYIISLDLINHFSYKCSQLCLITHISFIVQDFINAYNMLIGAILYLDKNGKSRETKR